MCNKICCGFGHREVYKDIAGQLGAVLEYAYNSGCNYFYTGGIGDFDMKFSGAVRQMKTKHPDIKLSLIIPYYTDKLNQNRAYYECMYDEIIMPDIIAGMHYKSAITARNHWIIDKSSLIVAYVYRDFGGAYYALKYAEKKGKEIINILT